MVHCHKLVAMPVYHHDFIPDEEFRADFLYRCFNSLALYEWGVFDFHTSKRKEAFTRRAVTAWNSSYETALILLAEQGVKHIRTVGVDGGVDYHPSFGIRTFPCTLDGQFKHAQETIDAYGLDVKRI
jgi:hypothetical protein